GGVARTSLLSHTASVFGGYRPTSTITFPYTTPVRTTSTVGTVTVTGVTTYSSPTVLATEVGTYAWHATYSGDVNNNGASDNGANESVTTVKASPAISTQAGETAGGVARTTVVRDTATVTGGYGPTGTITFTLTAPDGSTSAVGTVTVRGAGTYSSPTVLATQVGTYTWHATYNGNGLNNGAFDDGTNESVTTVKASPAISTQAGETAGGVAGTALLSDTATLTGGDVPSGTITFTL